jgi:hypothetical protein
MLFLKRAWFSPPAYAARSNSPTSGHADGAVAEQAGGDGALRRIFREPEWIAGSFAVIPDTPY